MDKVFGMNYKKLGSILGKIMFLEAVLMLLPLTVSLVYREPFSHVLAFLIPIVLLILLGLLLRLWQLEELLGEEFLKINQSCLANVSRIKRFRASFGGSLLVSFACGYEDYVSRRQLKQVKERMGMVK